MIQKKVVIGVLVILLIGLPLVTTAYAGEKPKKENATDTSYNEQQALIDLIEYQKHRQNNTEQKTTPKSPIETGIWKTANTHATDVIYGKVLEVSSYWVNTTESKLIHSTAKIEVYYNFKKPENKTNTITITYEGGTVKNKSTKMIVNPYGDISLHLNETVLVYLDDHFKLRNNLSPFAIKHIQNSIIKTTLFTESMGGASNPILELQGCGFNTTLNRAWPDNVLPVPYKVNPNCPDNVTEIDQVNAIKNAFNTWSWVNESYVNFYYDGLTMLTIPDDDGVNTLYWDYEIYENWLAVCAIHDYPNGTLKGFDIEFNTKYEWSLDGDGNSYEIQGTATHEIGHAVGLKNLECSYSSSMTMHTPYHSDMEDLEWGDIAGASYLYPNDDVPTVNIIEPSASSDFLHSFNLIVSASCVDGIDTVEYRLGYQSYEKLSSWQSMIYNGTHYTAIVEIPDQTFPSGNYWITTRAKSDTTPAIYGYDWTTVDYNGWLIGWDYRKAITITGSSEGATTDYSIPVKVYYGTGTDGTETNGPLTMGKIYCSSKCQTDFDDIRFTSLDGQTKLGHWRETYTSSSNSIFWVEVESIPASPSTCTIYMYYGKNDASTDCNPYDTFHYYEDFEYGVVSQQPEGWKKIGGDAGDTLTVIDSIYYNGEKSVKLHENGGIDNAEFCGPTFTALQGYVYHCWFRFETGGRRTLTGPIDINNATVTSILCRDDANDWRRTVYSSGFATLSTWGGPTEDTWYRLEVFRRSSDGYVKYYKDRANGEGWYAPRSYNNARSVWVRGRLDSITDAYFDVFYIRKYSSPEPYASSIGVEQS